MKGVHIPTLRDDSDQLYRSGQPIMCFKELEVDRVRWDAYQMWLTRPMGFHSRVQAAIKVRTLGETH